MKPKEKNSDASFYYHEDATADVAYMDSSAVYGNLADAMKDAIVVFPTTQVEESVVMYPLAETETGLSGP